MIKVWDHFKKGGPTATFCHVLPHRHTSGYQGNSFNHTSIWRAVSCSDTLRSSGWLRWTVERILLKLKKNPDEKYFFIMEKFDFEKKSHFFSRSKKNQHFSILKNIFVHRKILRFFLFDHFFSKIIFQNQISP